MSKETYGVAILLSYKLDFQPKTVKKKKREKEGKEKIFQQEEKILPFWLTQIVAAFGLHHLGCLFFCKRITSMDTQNLTFKSDHP